MKRCWATRCYYGFDIIDLGKDVKCERVLEEVQKQGVKLVGLSALMTTTVPNMEKTITAGSTAPKIRRNNGRQKISPPAVIVKEITITVRKICLAALFAPLSSPFPR